MSKSSQGRFFEDFSVGQTIIHATPRTVTAADCALYAALYGSRFPVQSARTFARAAGYAESPVDDLLVFHIVFGKTVPDISLNAVANLGYAECRFLRTVHPGDTLSAVSDIIGVKENSNGRTGTVYLRTTGFNQAGEPVLSYVRWVMMRKRDLASPAPSAIVPLLKAEVPAAALGGACPPIARDGWDDALAGSPHRWEDYRAGEKIDHIDGMTVEESDHMLAARLYQNTARVHFNAHAELNGRFGRRLAYGGHVISLARALSFNGLGNAFHIAAINAGRHMAPFFAGGTVYAWSQVQARAAMPGRGDVGALRILTRATRDMACTGFPVVEAAEDVPGVILELDYWVLLPRHETGDRPSH